MNFIPMNRRILVEPTKKKEKTEGGLYIPENAKEKPVKGKIVSVSDDCQVLAAKNVGLTVVYGKYSGSEIEVESKTYLLLGEGEILGYEK